MAKAKTTGEETLLNVEIPKIEVNEARIHIVGDSPLISHAWSEKAKREILSKQMKKATSGKAARDPFTEFLDTLYWLSERPVNPTMEDVQKGRFGFPTIAFKACAIDAGFQQGVIAKKTTARGAFHLIGEFAEIKGTVDMREDMVRIGMGTADLRYRAEFNDWSTDLLIRYNPKVMSIDQIVNLFNIGGFANGVGEWRPAKDGVFGTFHVE